MDRLIYTSMSGAKYLLERQATLANNLANATTTGFRADTVGLRAVPVVGAQAGTRVFTVETTTGADFSQGPIPADAQSILIAADGTVSVKAASSKSPTTVGQLKLVNPPISDLIKGADGLFRTHSGEPADADASVKVADGTLEGSNVNVVEAMVGMIAASRQFELQMKMLSTAEQNEQKAGTVIG